MRDEAANPVLGRCVTSALIAPGDLRGAGGRGADWPAARGRGPRRAAARDHASMGDGGGHHPRRAGICSTLYVLLAVAGLIGAVGLITNSQVLIVAAMVVGPSLR